MGSSSLGPSQRALTPDVVVIGAGINGAGIARAAARAGLAVLVLEQSDVSSGTTSASTRLIHGGLRYLEHGELGLVRESLREREALLALAPHLVEPLRLYLPIYRGARRPRWQIRIGMALYDLLSRGKSLPSHRMLSRDELLAQMPGLAAHDLVGGATYFDAQVSFPERLVVENLLDAAAHGTVVMNHTAAEAIRVERGSVIGVDWRRADGTRGHVATAWVVNAAGPWLDRVAASIRGIGSRTDVLVGGTKGSHLVCAPFPGAPQAAVYAEAASDGRPFFIVPWNGLYLIGTTDVRYDGDPADVAIDDRELDYLVRESERLFPDAAIRERVLYTMAGVRALPFAPGRAEGAITRRHLVHAHRDVRGLYSLVGGKLTTYRSLADDVLARLSRDGLAPRRRDARRAGTADAQLPGAIAGTEREALAVELAGTFGERTASRMLRTYGRLSARLLAVATERPELAASAGPGAELRRVEIVHAFETEWADSLVDLLQRRTMLGLGADFGFRDARAAAAALVELGIWEDARAEDELADYRRFAALHRAAGTPPVGEPAGRQPASRGARASD